MKKIIPFTSLILTISVLLSACSQNKVNINKDLPLEKETEHFQIRYTEGDENAAEDMADVLENAYEDLTVKYQSIPNEKIGVAIYPTYETMQEVYQKILNKGENAVENTPTALGVTLSNSLFIITSPNDWQHSGASYEEALQTAVHELTHVLTVPYNLPVYLREGLAVYEQGELKNETYLIRFALDNKKGLSFPASLEELTSMDLDDQHGAVYAYGAVFVEYVVQKYGYDELVKFLKAKGDITTLGTDNESFYNEWLQYVEEHY